MLLLLLYPELPPCGAAGAEELLLVEVRWFRGGIAVMTGGRLEMGGAGRW